MMNVDFRKKAHFELQKLLAEIASYLEIKEQLVIKKMEITSSFLDLEELSEWLEFSKSNKEKKSIEEWINEERIKRQELESRQHDLREMEAKQEEILRIYIIALRHSWNSQYALRKEEIKPEYYKEYIYILTVNDEEEERWEISELFEDFPNFITQLLELQFQMPTERTRIINLIENIIREDMYDEKSFDSDDYQYYIR